MKRRLLALVVGLSAALSFAAPDSKPAAAPELKAGVLSPVMPAPALRDRCGPSRIDAMAPAGWRSDPARRRLVRRSRASLQRQLHGLKAFGVTRWIAAEIHNLIAPLRQRADV